jgi:hypothetical protein
MPKVNAFDVIKYMIQGVAEDISRKKMMSGVGKWNDMVVEKKKKKEPPKKTPWTSFGQKNAEDIQRAARARNRAISQ